MASVRSSAPLVNPSSEATRRARARSPMDKRPRFFKVFFSLFSSKRLVIPLAFRKHIELQTAGCSTYLKGPSGNVWNVDLATDKDGSMAFRNGWEDFARDHCLTTGDFLVFRYDGGLSFTVLVFDPNACEKVGAFDVTPSQAQEVTIVGERHPKRRAKPELEDEVIIIDPEAAFPCRSTIKRKRPAAACQVDVPKEYPCSSEILSGQRPHGDDGSLVSNGASVDCCSGHEAQETSTPNEPTQRPNRLPVVKGGSPDSPHEKKSVKKQPCRKISRTSSTLDVDSSEKKICRGSVESCRRAVTERENATALEAARRFQSKRPFGLSVMRRSYVRYGFFMCLPSSFSRHLPNSKTEMKLRGPCNEPWKVTYISKVKYGSTGGFSAGWGRFSSAHNLKPDDVCVFELLKPSEVQVHIFRAAEEDPVLRRSNRRRT